MRDKYLKNYYFESNMIITVASQNQVKVNAVKETLQLYPHFSGAIIKGRTVPSEISEQPKSLKETTEGAINRARNAFDGSHYSIGLESGLIQVPMTKTGYMDICVCAIYDGKQIHLGLSQAFECPPEVMRLVHEEGLDLSQASVRVGLTDNPHIGSDQGIIGLLTRGRVTRKDYTKEALKMALIHLENGELYHA